jgi:TolA-binding protein
MTHIPMNIRLASLFLLGAALLIPLAVAKDREAPAHPGLSPAPVERNQKAVRQAPAKAPGTLETSPMPLQWQIDQLRAQVHALQQQVQALQGQGSPVANLHQRVNALESVVQVSPTSVRIQSPGSIELMAQGTMDLQSGQALGLSATKVNVGSAMLVASGTVKSDTVVTNSVVASSYTRWGRQCLVEKFSNAVTYGHARVRRRLR